MKLVTFLHDNKEAVGVLTEDGAAVRPLPFADMNALIQASREALLAAVKGAAATLPLSAVTLLAPIPRPRQDVICLGINYKATRRRRHGTAPRPSPRSAPSPSISLSA